MQTGNRKLILIAIGTAVASAMALLPGGTEASILPEAGKCIESTGETEDVVRVSLKLVDDGTEPKDTRGDFVVEIDGEPVWNMVNMPLPTEEMTKSFTVPAVQLHRHTVRITYTGNNSRNPKEILLQSGTCPVGGIAEPVTLSGGAASESAGGSGPSAGALGAIAGGAAAAAALAVAGGWYARRRLS